MRDIRFRAWDKKDNVMRQVSMMTVTGGELAKYETYYFSTETSDNKGFRYALEVEIMQSTGLKDKNGKEIYAGDIYDIGICTKIIRPEHFVEDTYELMKMLEDNATVEVVGNIYEE